MEGASFEDVAIVGSQGQPVTLPAPETWSDDAAVGAIAWSDPENAGTVDLVFASAAEGSSHYLKGLNPGFAVPASATVTGISVDVARRANSA